MKTQIFFIAIGTLLTVALFIGCDSTPQSEEEAQQELKETNQDATFAAQKEDIAEEWKVFKADMDKRIAINDKRISEIRIKLEKTGKNLDKAYEKKIESLEQQNRDLRARIDSFETNQRDWQSFKREFNQDLDDLGKALQDFTEDNKK